MSLHEKQVLFARLLGEFIVWIFQQPGYAIVGGDWHRTAEQAAENAVKGVGIVHSLHMILLACDLSLFLNGVYRTDTDAYRPLGEKWKSMHPLCRWGGDFTTRPDGGHFSIEHEGIR
jgi:hypothetical protein